jgi:ATP-binding cassette subfamily B protein
LGKPLSEWGHQQLRQQVAVVSQRPFLFAMNIRDNLCLGENYSEQEIWRVLEICGIDREIESLPDRLDTFLGEWGINLSGGQKQRLTIARALIRRPKILFLDDCLSAVDTVTEEHILAQLDQHLKDVTVIWAAHRPSTLRYCHKILELPYVSRQ